MKHVFRISLIALLVSGFLLTPGIARAEATVPLICDGSLYAINGPSDTANSVFSKYAYDGANPPNLREQPAIASFGTVNAMAYNTQDRYLYAVGRRPANKNDLFRIDANGNRTNLGKIQNIPDTYTNLSGSFMPNGKMYIFSGEPGAGRFIYEVDINTRIATRINTNLDFNKAWDIGFNVNDGLLYGYDWNGGASRLFSIKIEGNTGTVTRFGPVHGYREMGSVWVFGNKLYGYENTTGVIREFNIGQGSGRGNFTGFEKATQSSSEQNDGANCPTGPPPFLNYPWLQTQKGDVTSLGYISGQTLGLGVVNTSPLGARHTSSGDRSQPYSGGAGVSTISPEAFFLVVGSELGEDFCSLYLYTLGQNLSSRQNCKTGGYGATAIDNSSMRNALNFSWTKNGSGEDEKKLACSPYNTSNTFSANVNLGCKNGGITKIEGNYTFNTTSKITGKGTLWVKGNLTISSDILYENVSSDTLAAELNNFAIFVEGNITIADNVTTINASLIATGTINTCSSSQTVGAACVNRLTSYGYVAGFDQINFSRRYFSTTNPNASPAEQIILTGQAVMFPPPGLSSSDGDNNEQLEFDNGEFAPRLN